MGDRLHVVVETNTYLARCHRIGVSDADRAAIVNQVARDPSDGDLVRGSGGVRKVRYGGRGGYRVMAAYFDRETPVYLLSILDKGQSANFTEAQVRVMQGITKAIKSERVRHRGDRRPG